MQENSSRGTDHGAASCLFVAGPSVKGGVVGKHPSLKDLDADDLKFHTDFRRVYATQLDSWLGCDSKAVLGAKLGPRQGIGTEGMTVAGTTRELTPHLAGCIDQADLEVAASPGGIRDFFSPMVAQRRPFAS